MHTSDKQCYTGIPLLQYIKHLKDVDNIFKTEENSHHVDKYYSNPIESEKQITNEIGENACNLVVINLKTLAKIVDEIRKNKNDILIKFSSVLYIKHQKVMITF